MKKVLIALFISFLFVLFYAIVAFVFAPLFAGETMLEISKMWQTPLRLPVDIYNGITSNSTRISLDPNPTSGILLKILVCFCNVFLYAIPVYLFLSVLSFIRKILINSEY